MSDFNIEFEENDQQITLEFKSGVGGAVSSVNGMTGDVVLDAEDVGALPTSTPIPTVDNTLTTAGAAADAKKTGDEIATVKDGLSTIEENFPKEVTSESAVAITDKPYNCYLKGVTNSQYDATVLIDGVNIKVTALNGQTTTKNAFMIGAGQIGKANGNLFAMDRIRTGASSYETANGRSNSSAIELSLFKTRCDYSIAAANEYLSENPIRIWYQTPDYATATKFCEYIVCTGTENYAVIGTTDAINPLTANDYIDFGKGVIVRGTAEESIALSGGVNDIPNNVTVTGSGIIGIVSLADLTDALESVVMKDGWNEVNPKNTSFFDNINYFDSSEASYLTGVFATTNGQITTTANTCSLIMPVKASTQYILYVPDNNRGIVVGNSERVFEPGETYSVLYNSGVNQNGYLFTTGSTDKYIFAYIYSGTYDYEANKNGIRLVEGNALPSYEKPIVKKENLPQDIVGATSPLEGTKVLVFGDSITDTCNFTINSADQTTAVTWKNPSNSYVDAGGNTIQYNMWAKILKDMGVCAEIRNYARSGASYQDAQRASGEERQNLSYQITVALNDLDNPNGVFEIDDFVPDIVIFALGTNDGTPDDTYDDAMAKTVLKSDGYSIDTTATLANLDMSKFCESARSAFMRTRIAFPFAQFYCVLPIQRANNEVNGEAMNTYLRQMAERYGCVIVNGFAESGIIRDTNVWNTLGATLKDGLHPNDKGQNMLFRAIYGTLKSHYIVTSTMNP